MFDTDRLFNVEVSLCFDTDRLFNVEVSLCLILTGYIMWR